MGQGPLPGGSGHRRQHRDGGCCPCAGRRRCRCGEGRHRARLHLHHPYRRRCRRPADHGGRQRHRGAGGHGRPPDRRRRSALLRRCRQGHRCRSQQRHDRRTLRRHRRGTGRGRDLSRTLLQVLSRDGLARCHGLFGRLQRSLLPGKYREGKAGPGGHRGSRALQGQRPERHPSARRGFGIEHGLHRMRDDRGDAHQAPVRARQHGGDARVACP